MPFAEFFPNGVWPYLAGGILLGLATALIYLTTGLITGASTFLESTLSYVCDYAQFRRYVDSRDWRLVFTLGIVAGAAVYAVTVQQGIWVTQVQWWRLLFGGILVGFGTRMGRGCTSGHGICGLGSLSTTSLVNVATFVLIAIGTAHIVEALGVTP